MPSIVPDLVNQNQTLASGLVQVSHHLTDRRENCTHRQRQPVETSAVTSPGPLSVSDVMHSRIADRPTFVSIIKLLAVVGQDGVESSASCVGKQVQILLALPSQLVDMRNCVARKHLSECMQ